MRSSTTSSSGRKKSSRESCAPEFLWALRLFACRPFWPACRTLNHGEGRPLSGREQPHGRHSPDLGSRPATRERYAHRAERVWQISPPTLDDRLPVLSAPDHDHHLPRRIPHFLLDLPVDAEQGADTFHWPRQFQLSAVARRLL